MVKHRQRRPDACAHTLAPGMCPQPPVLSLQKSQLSLLLGSDGRVATQSATRARMADTPHCEHMPHLEALVRPARIVACPAVLTLEFNREPPGTCLAAGPAEEQSKENIQCHITLIQNDFC